MSSAHFQLLEMASKVGPRVADKAGLELLFNFPFLIIKNQYMEDYKPLRFDFVYQKQKMASLWWCMKLLRPQP